MRAVQPSFHLIVALKWPDVVRVSLKPQVTLFGSLGSNLPAWVMKASIGLPVSASTTLPDTSTDCGAAAGCSFVNRSGGWDRAREDQRQVTTRATSAAPLITDATIAVHEPIVGGRYPTVGWETILASMDLRSPGNTGMRRRYRVKLIDPAPVHKPPASPYSV